MGSPDPHNQKPIEKAGFVIYGRNGRGDFFTKGQLCVVAGYTQNRFGDDANKYYSLVKGSVDPEDGSPLKGARRETEEESGVNIKKLLGKENLSEIKRGRDVQGVVGDYGIKVRRAYGTPSDFEYISASGKKPRTHMYFIELEDGEIDKLGDTLKKQPFVRGDRYNPSQPTLSYTAQDYLRAHNYPELSQLLDIMRTGRVTKIKDCGWAPKDEKLFDKPVFPEREKAWCAKHGIETISDRTQWQQFYEDMKHEHRTEYDAMRKQFMQIKRYFENIGLVGDATFLKFDEKDRPLTFFFEGAEILPINHVLIRSAKLAHTNPHYASAMWGGPEGDMQYAQIAGYFPRAATQPLQASPDFSIRSVLESLKTTAEYSKLGYPEQMGISKRLTDLRNALATGVEY